MSKIRITWLLQCMDFSYCHVSIYLQNKHVREWLTKLPDKGSTWPLLSRSRAPSVSGKRAYLPTTKQIKQTVAFRSPVWFITMTRQRIMYYSLYHHQWRLIWVWGAPTGADFVVIDQCSVSSDAPSWDTVAPAMEYFGNLYSPTRASVLIAIMFMITHCSSCALSIPGDP